MRSSRILMSSFFIASSSKKSARPASRADHRTWIAGSGNLLERRDVGALRAALEERERVGEDVVGDPRLRRPCERVRSVVVVDRHLVLLAAHGLLDEVRDDHGDLLAQALFL